MKGIQGDKQVIESIDPKESKEENSSRSEWEILNGRVISRKVVDPKNFSLSLSTPLRRNRKISI